MRRRRLGVGIGVPLAALLLAATLAAVAAAAAGPVDRPFPGGAISRLAIDDGPTQGSFADVSYRYDGCGTQAGETACTWRVDVGLAPEGFELCPSTLEAARTIWSSGEQTANGTVASGPKTFALRGFPGQVLCVVLSQTVSSEASGSKFTSGSTTVLHAIRLDDDLVTPVEAVELRIIRANTPASIPPPPTPTPFFVDPDCRSLTIGTTRYAFLYKRIGCRKATDLAKMAHISGGAPSGYRCADRAAGGKRCSREGDSRKFVEWRLPRQRPPGRR
jgi:hypothetical protein